MNVVFFARARIPKIVMHRIFRVQICTSSRQQDLYATRGLHTKSTGQPPVEGPLSQPQRISVSEGERPSHVTPAQP